MFYMYCLGKYILDDSAVFSLGYDLQNFAFVEEHLVADVFRGT